MNNKVLSCLIAGVLGATLALASPALARGGGGGGGMHGGGMGGGMHAGGMGGGMQVGAISGGTRFGLGLQRSRSGTASITARSSITASITASIALRSLVCPSPTLPTTAAGARCGRQLDGGGSTSAATTYTSAAEAHRDCCNAATY